MIDTCFLIRKGFYKLSFEYDFLLPNDLTYFSLSEPYTFSKLYETIKEIREDNHSTLY